MFNGVKAVTIESYKHTVQRQYSTSNRGCEHVACDRTESNNGTVQVLHRIYFLVMEVEFNNRYKEG